jgi:hypothetical protein
VPAAPAKPHFALDGMLEDGTTNNMFFRQSDAFPYPDIMDAVLEVYCADTQSGLLSDKPDVVDATYMLQTPNVCIPIKVPAGKAKWYGFRACYGKYKSAMQVVRAASLAKPANLQAAASASSVTLSWTPVKLAARYEIYATPYAPDMMRSWSENKVTLAAAGGLRFMGNASGASATLNKGGAHGFSEILYAYSSAGNNNGSAFAGLGVNTIFYNVTLALAMLLARFVPIGAMLGIAGSLAEKKKIPASAGTLATHNPLFVGLLVAVVLIIGALNVNLYKFNSIVVQYNIQMFNVNLLGIWLKE